MQQDPAEKPSFGITLADVKALVEQSTSVDARKKREICSAINMFGMWRDLPLHQIPATPEILRRHLAALHHQHVGVTQARLANVRSLINKALAVAGVKATNRPVAVSLSPDWQTVMAGLPDRYLRSSLAPFARYCSDHNILPHQVDDTVGASYLEFLDKTSIRGKPRTVHQTVCRTWNKAGDLVPGWPDNRLTVPVYKERYTLTWEQVPQTLRDEVESYLSRLACDDIADLLDENAPPRPLKPLSIQTKRYQVLQFVSALVHRGVQTESLGSLAAVVTKEHFKLALGYLLQRPRQDKTSTRSAGLVAHTIRSIAKHWLKDTVPQKEFDDLNQITKNLNRPQLGMTDKNRRRLNQFEDDAVLARFLNFAFDGLDRILGRRSHSYRDAVEAQIYIAIIIVIYAPMRLENLAELRLGEHMKLPLHNKTGETVLSIQRGSVKNEQPLMFILPEDVTSYIVKYVKIIKPILEKEVSPVLFPNGRGRQKRKDTLGKQISGLIRNKLGLEFNTHLARHLAAKLNIDAHPGDYETTRRLLAHTNHDTTYKTYQGMETASASRVHDEVISDKRRYVSLSERPRAKKRLNTNGAKPPAAKKIRRG